MSKRSVRVWTCNATPPDTLKDHSAKNKALAAMSDDHRQRFAHFAEEVELPTDAVGFQHVPSEAVRAMKRDAQLKLPKLLARYGVEAIPDAAGT